MKPQFPTRLPFDPVTLVQSARAHGLIGGPSPYAVAEQPAKAKAMGTPKTLPEPKPAPTPQKEFALAAENDHSADLMVAVARLRLSQATLLAAANANKSLLGNPDWQECLSLLNKLLA